MEEVGFEEEPYCTMSPVVLMTDLWTQSKSTNSPPSETFHIRLTRDHFIPIILTFDDW